MNFLQPTRYYYPNDSLFQGSIITPKSKNLSNIFFNIEKELTPLSFNSNLTHLDHAKFNFRDECHPDLNGYKYLADESAPYLINQILSMNKGSKTKDH